ncbi:gastrula zinc finger protein xFG20-1-like [Penaeus monodon]|uniref:gastrula zinc finger protein xFG20-1-like n=1 Tax=Penaeus monodon TaxID=6687 RepID=UPI0018A6E03E|nr:gastrula zinc finger protein xFG20-1-like [Penaeus monodon]
MGVHANEKPYSCEICNKESSSKSNLAMHDMTYKLKIHPVKPLISAIGLRKTSLVKHMIVQRSNTTVIFAFSSSKRNLTMHIGRHTNEKPFSCEVCHKIFLSKHFRQNTSKYMPSRSICIKAEIVLVQHLQLHEKKKLYSCEDNNKPFTQKCI